MSGRYRGQCHPGTGAASRKCLPATGATVSSMDRDFTGSEGYRMGNGPTQRVGREHYDPVTRDFERTPNGIRTRVTALKGRRPRPLDDGGSAGRRPPQRTSSAAQPRSPLRSHSVPAGVSRTSIPRSNR